MKIIVFVIIALMFDMTAKAETFFFVGSHFPILTEETPDGDFSGIAIDIVRIIGARLGHTINVRLYPWERAKYMVKTGKADVLMPPFKTPEREKWLDFTENFFFTDRSFFYIKPGSTVSWDGDYSSLKGRIIGVVAGWSVGPVFDHEKASLSIDYAPTLDLCFKKLLAGRIDMIPTQVREAHAAFDRLGLINKQKPIIILPELNVNYNYFGFTKQKDLSGFKKEFDKALKQMRESKEIFSLLQEKYGLSNEEM